jgi:predicted sugar kinase
MGLLPAVVEADLEAFGEALTEIQAITGRWWAPAQGGPFAPGPSADLVEAMRGWGAHGVGQSSWGPAVYGIVEGEAAGKSLAERVRESVGPAGRVYVGTFPETGARVWRGAAAPGESIPVTGG